jgi:hypothetical protein
MSDVICDFCSTPQIRWRYPCNGFTILLILQGGNGQTRHITWSSTGDWFACEDCSHLIETNDWDGLGQRCVILRHPELPAVIRQEVKKSLVELHKEFQRNRRSEGRVHV